MDRQVFISYAADDADWTTERVDALATAIRAAGPKVLLDAWHRKEKQRYLSDDEWHRWMSESLGCATNVICLASSRYCERWERDESEVGGFGVAFESVRLVHKLYSRKQHNHGWILTLRLDHACMECIPEDLLHTCPKYRWREDLADLIDHLTKAEIFAPKACASKSSSAKSPVAVPEGAQLSVNVPIVSAESPAATGPRPDRESHDEDLLDLAWRKALSQSTANVRAVLFTELLEESERKGLVPDDLQQAIADAFERQQGATNLLARVKFALHKSERLAPRLSPEERHERTRLCLMLLVRSAALVCRSNLQGKMMGDLTVPERERRLAIAVAAHVIFGQGVRLVVEPGGVRPDNLIDTIACEDAQAHMPGQAPARTPLEREVDAWLQRVSGATHTAQTTADLKAYLDAYEQEAHSRPILLDGERLLLDQTVRSLAADLRMGIVDIASDGRPANIPRGIWLDLCSQLDQQIAELTAIVPARLADSSSSPSTQDASGPMTPSIPAAQVTVQQTIYGRIGQSNVTTGSHSPLHANQSGVGSTDEAHDPLAAAVLGLQMALHGDPALQADLRELHPLLLGRQLSSSAMSQIARVLPSLRRAGLAPEASEAWARLRAVVHAHWPDSRDFFH